LENYIRSIALTVVFSAFIELFVPNGNLKKYIDIVTGFIIIIVLMQPIKEIFFNSGELELEVFNIQTQIENNSVLNQAQYLEEKQKQLVINTYTENLKRQICEVVSKGSDVEIESIDIELENENYSISNIELYGYEKNNNSNDEKISIDEIKIGNKAAQAYNVQERNYQAEENLKNLISDFYKIEMNNIYIIVRNIRE